MINSRLPVERECKMETAKELETKPCLDKIRHYTTNWTRRINRNPSNKIASVMKSYILTYLLRGAESFLRS